MEELGSEVPNWVAKSVAKGESSVEEVNDEVDGSEATFSGPGLGAFVVLAAGNDVSSVIDVEEEKVVSVDVVGTVASEDGIVALVPVVLCTDSVVDTSTAVALEEIESEVVVAVGCPVKLD